MNKFLIFILFYLLFCDPLNSQDYLKVLGRTDYTKEPDLYRLRLMITKNEDTLLNNNTFLSQIYNSQNVTKIDTSLENQVILDISKNNLEDIIDLIKIQKNLSTSMSYLYENKNFEYQDQLAIEALKNATQKAEYFAKLLNKKIERIENIDDIVEKYHFYPNYHPTTECHKKAIVLIMEYFGTPEDPGKIEFEESKQSGQYAIWVTFKLE